MKRSVLNSSHRLLDSLVVECWLRVREVPGSIPSQGPRHTKDVITMVPVVPLFSSQHWKGKILALSLENNLMDKIWYRKSFKDGGHWPLWPGWKKRINTQNRQKSNARKNKNLPQFSCYLNETCYTWSLWKFVSQIPATFSKSSKWMLLRVLYDLFVCGSWQRCLKSYAPF